MVKLAIIAFLAVTFLTESLFPNAEVVEFIKVPELLQHFENHRQENPSITFYEFLHLHYGDSQHTQRDLKHHQKLPFSKTHHHHVAGFQVIQTPEEIKSAIGFTLLRKIDVVLYAENKVSTPVSGVWQPPKVS